LRAIISDVGGTLLREHPLLDDKKSAGFGPSGSAERSASRAGGSTISPDISRRTGARIRPTARTAAPRCVNTYGPQVSTWTNDRPSSWTRPAAYRDRWWRPWIASAA